MVDRGSQRNQAVARAVAARFATRPAVCDSIVVTAGIKRAAASTRADGNSTRSNSAALVRGPVEPLRAHLISRRDAACRVSGRVQRKTGQAPSLHNNRRQKARFLPRLRQLLEPVSDLKQRGLAPGASEEGDADR